MHMLAIQFQRYGCHLYSEGYFTHMQCLHFLLSCFPVLQKENKNWDDLVSGKDTMYR